MYFSDELKHLAVKKDDLRNLLIQLLLLSLEQNFDNQKSTGLFFSASL